MGRMFFTAGRKGRKEWNEEMGIKIGSSEATIGQQGPTHLFCEAPVRPEGCGPEGYGLHPMKPDA
jgi:hypothetical protein